MLRSWWTVVDGLVLRPRGGAVANAREGLRACQVRSAAHTEAAQALTGLSGGRGSGVA